MHRKPDIKGCRKPLNFSNEHVFEDVLLAINFNHPFYDVIPLLKSYYKLVFPNLIICGPVADSRGQTDIVVISEPNEYGYYGYQCLVEAIRRKPGYAGYLYVNDDMIVNWWRLHSLDRSKIWFRIDGFGSRDMDSVAEDFWWTRANCLERCRNAFQALSNDETFKRMNAVEIYMENVGQKRVCANGLSDIVYIPARLAKNFELIGQKFYDNRLFLEVATPMAVLMMEQKRDVVQLDGVYLQLKYMNWGPWTGNTRRAWKHYDYSLFFLHPYKFYGDNVAKNSAEFVERVQKTSEKIIKQRCLDPLEADRFWLKES